MTDTNIVAGMTSAGLRLLALSQTGSIIHFTKMKVGDGVITDETISDMTDLINVVDNLNIEKFTTEENEDGSYTLKVVSNIKQAATAYYFRELGLFAIDPETDEEVLYSYVNKGSEATYIPEISSNIATQELASMIVAIGNTTNIVVNCDAEVRIIEHIEGNGGYSLFDTVLKDHELSFEESEGFGLQGTWVYKEGIEGERWGYPDFYEKCLEEKEAATRTRTVFGETSIITYNHTNGHIYYDVADKSVIDTSYNALGVAWFYGIDEENERIFLPRNDYFFKSDSSDPGEYVAPELPPITHSHTATANTVADHTHTRGTQNITASFSMSEYKHNWVSLGGAAYDLGQINVFGESNEYWGDNHAIGFNAAASWTGESSANGAHTHTITVSSENSPNNIYTGTTVLPPASKMLLYIVVGNVRQKPAVVINEELQNAIRALTSAKNADITAINNSKDTALSDINSAKNTAVTAVENKGTSVIGTIDEHVDDAKDYAEAAADSADLARQYADLAIDGQVQVDFAESDSTKVTFIKNKPNVNYSQLVYLSNSQTLTNKTIAANSNTITGLTASNFAASTIVNDLSVSDNLTNSKIPTSLATVNIIDSKNNALRVLLTNLFQPQIDALTAASDVVDTVGTKAALLVYDTTTLTENDIIKVLADESLNGAISEYRWSNSAWALVGSVGPYYTKTQVDNIINQIQIDQSAKSSVIIRDWSVS